jgi:hypothetical protein
MCVDTVSKTRHCAPSNCQPLLAMKSKPVRLDRPDGPCWPTHGTRLVESADRSLCNSTEKLRHMHQRRTKLVSVSTAVNAAVAKRSRSLMIRIEMRRCNVAMSERFSVLSHWLVQRVRARLLRPARAVPAERGYPPCTWDRACGYVALRLATVFFAAFFLSAR